MPLLQSALTSVVTPSQTCPFEELLRPQSTSVVSQRLLHAAPSSAFYLPCQTYSRAAGITSHPIHTSPFPLLRPYIRLVYFCEVLLWLLVVADAIATQRLGGSKCSVAHWLWLGALYLVIAAAVVSGGAAVLHEQVFSLSLMSSTPCARATNLAMSVSSRSSPSARKVRCFCYACRRCSCNERA